MPKALQNLALLNLCPDHLQKSLNQNTDVATGRIGYDELKGLIMTAVHQRWNSKGNGIHSLEPEGPTTQGTGEDFEIGGELYRLEVKNGKKVMVKKVMTGNNLFVQMEGRNVTVQPFY